MGKIGFLEIWNPKAGMIEQSEERLRGRITLVAGVLIAIASVLPWLNISLGDSLPLVITLLSYSFGSKLFQKAIEVKGVNLKKE